MPADGVPPQKDMLIFLDGCFNGEMSDVRWFLRYYPRHIECHCKGKTGLMYAAGKGCGGIISELLKNGAAANAVDNEGRNALHHAALEGREYTVKQLLESKVKIRADNTGIMPLHLAADHKDPGALRNLLAATTDDIDTPDNSGFTPLWHAVMNRRTKSVRLLLDAGARIDIKVEGRTVTDYAEKIQQELITEMLLEEPARRATAIGAAIDSGISGGITVKRAMKLVRKNAAP